MVEKSVNSMTPRLTWPFEPYTLVWVPIPSPSLPSAPNFHESEIMPHPDKFQNSDTKTRG